MKNNIIYKLETVCLHSNCFNISFFLRIKLLKIVVKSKVVEWIWLLACAIANKDIN